ncbi:MAG: alpha/beta hydrolase [Candidatus Baltobacteraceae bacterium]
MCGLRQTRLRHHALHGGGGTGLHAVESGNPAGRPILLVHGWSQSHASWARQLASPALSERFRLVALDLRGHGDSEKPAGLYADSQLWADDIRLTLEALALDGAVLCGWSYGGYVLNDYLRCYGGARLGGLHYVSAATDAGGRMPYRFMGKGWEGILPAPGATGPSAYSEGAEEAAAVMRTFVRRCFARPPEFPAELTMLGISLSTPPRVRRELFARKLRNDDVLGAVTLPALVTHGARDAIVDVETGRHIAGRIAGARLSLYEDAGHMPFWEESDRFERELAEFASGLP